MGSRFGPQSRSIRFALGFLLIFGTVSTGCINKDGDPLPAGLMSFPIAIKLSLDKDADGKPKYVYVTSSNFALQYNSGNVQSYDLDKAVSAIEATCMGPGVRSACLDPGYAGDIRDPSCACAPLSDPDCVPTGTGILQSCLEPSYQGDVNAESCACNPLFDAGGTGGAGGAGGAAGAGGTGQDACVTIPANRCTVVPPQLEINAPNAALKVVRVPGLLPGEVEIGSFSDGMGLSTDGRRIYVPVRSDANLTFIDVNENGQLRCGGEYGQWQTCTSEYRSGSIEQVNPNVDIVLPPDPVDVYVGDLAADFGSPSNPDDPAFRGDYILMAHREGKASMFFDQLRPGGPEPVKRPRLAATIDGLAPEQVTITLEPGSKRAWIPSQEAATVIRVGIGIDGDPTQSYLFNAGTLLVSGLDNGAQNRDIVFDPRPGRNLAYIVSKAPQALVVARSEAPGGNLSMIGQVSACRDPSRVQLAEIPARGGTVLLAFVSCYLSNNVFIIDIDELQGISLLTNMTGAFEFVIDGPRLLMYIADFSSSVLRVTDLRQLVKCLEVGADTPEECAPVLIGLVGLPQPVSELPR